MSALPQLRALHAPLPLTSLAPLAQPRHAAAAPMAHVEHDDAGTVPFQQKGSEGERFAGAPTNEQLSSGLLFFGNRLCPFAHRAWLAMHEKGVADEFTYIHVDLGEDKPAWFKERVSPRFGTVPCIIDFGRRVFESAICVEFIEERFPGRGTPLMPLDAAERAAVRLFVSHLDFAPLYRFLMEQDRSRDAAHADACAAALADMESRYAAQSPGGGPYFLGERLSAADIALLPFIARLGPALKAFRGYHVCDVQHTGCNSVLPRICAAMHAMQARPSWHKTACEPSVYVSALEGYAAGRPGVPRRVRASSPDAAAFAAVPPADA